MQMCKINEFNNELNLLKDAEISWSCMENVKSFC